VKVSAPVINNRLIMRLHAEHLLQLALDAGGFGMVEAGHFAEGGSWIKN